MKNNDISLIGANGLSGETDVLNALASSCGLNIRSPGSAEVDRPMGYILLGDASPPPFAKERPRLHIKFSDITVRDARIMFSSSKSAPSPFAGRTIYSDSVAGPRPDDLTPAEIIASSDGAALWTTTNEFGLRSDTCWVPRLWIVKGDCVFDHLNGKRLMNLLPVLDWLRSLSGWTDWSAPPLRACFMFDDPNLHGDRYGFAKFRELAADGSRNHYHTSFATVPLDGFYVKGSAARTMRENNRTLSLLIHGNNHTKRELAGSECFPLQSAMMRQAIQRIEKLEKKATLRIARVMAPPHGVCTAQMMAAMVDAMFEAVCVSHGSVKAGNPGANWTASLGAVSAMNICGLPVIPRFGLSRNQDNQVLLAAYLEQPIIPVGHHWDLANGTDILSDSARMINSLGNVAWVNMTEIARSNYRFRVEKGIMTIKTSARIFDVKIPDDVHTVIIDADWIASRIEILKMRILEGKLRSHSPTSHSHDGVFSVIPGTRVEFFVERLRELIDHSVRLPKTSSHVFARRLLVEARDRLMPHLPRKFTRQ